MLHIGAITDLCSRQKTNERNKQTTTYPSRMLKEVEEIKKVLQSDPTPQIYFGNNWVRINGKNYNGISRDIFNKIVGEIKNGV